MQGRTPPLFLIYLALIVIGIKTFAPYLFDQSIYRGESFSVKKPAGWTMKKEKNEVTFISPEADFMTDIPYAYFSIYSEKQQGALFMEDFFPEVLSSIERDRAKILGTGDELIDGQKARWVRFRYKKPDLAVVTLYIADDFNRLTRIQYVSNPKKFAEYGKQFDEFKKTIKLKTMF